MPILLLGFAFSRRSHFQNRRGIRHIMLAIRTKMPGSTMSQKVFVFRISSPAELYSVKKLVKKIVRIIIDVKRCKLDIYTLFVIWTETYKEDLPFLYTEAGNP